MAAPRNTRKTTDKAREAGDPVGRTDDTPPVPADGRSVDEARSEEQDAEHDARGAGIDQDNEQLGEHTEKPAKPEGEVYRKAQPTKKGDAPEIDDTSNVTATQDEMLDPENWPGDPRVSPGDPGTDPDPNVVSRDPRGAPYIPSDAPENTTGSPVDPVTGLIKGHPGETAPGQANDWPGEEAGARGAPIGGQEPGFAPARPNEDQVRRTNDALDHQPERFAGNPANTVEKPEQNPGDVIDEGGRRQRDR